MNFLLSYGRCSVVLIIKCLQKVFAKTQGSSSPKASRRWKQELLFCGTVSRIPEGMEATSAEIAALQSGPVPSEGATRLAECLPGKRRVSQRKGDTRSSYVQRVTLVKNENNWNSRCRLACYEAVFFSPNYMVFAFFRLQLCLGRHFLRHQWSQLIKLNQEVVHTLNSVPASKNFEVFSSIWVYSLVFAQSSRFGNSSLLRNQVNLMNLMRRNLQYGTARLGRARRNKTWEIVVECIVCGCYRCISRRPSLLQRQ